MSSSADVLIVCAMRVEAQAMPSHLQTLVTGPGFQAVRSGLARLLDVKSPKLVISAGTCGALDPALRIGDVLLVGTVKAEGKCLPTTALGGAAVLWSQDRVAVLAREKQSLRDLGAQIVDMEAIEVASLCLERGIPFGCVKAVSDLAGEDLPLDFNHYRDELGRFRNSRIAIAGIMKLPQLLRLKRNTERAAKSLGVAIERILSEAS